MTTFATQLQEARVERALLAALLMGLLAVSTSGFVSWIWVAGSAVWALLAVSRAMALGAMTRAEEAAQVVTQGDSGAAPAQPPRGRPRARGSSRVN